ncbi:glycosyltransferase [Ruminococcus sp.]|uniref:glycosyltransferase n=1 Tax=Ruminococcus sp. TaxID=41978 RepID=UPI0025DA7675|nr:glycosyltransferase [Ruminococcus sp.]
MEKVAVLMSTYNGEKYIKEQIDSILAQKDTEVSLYIRDDGSKDSTLDIIREICSENENVHLLVGKNNLGVGNSFMNLIYIVPDTFDYYALSDQDDIWCEEKLIEAIKLLKETDCSLYASNQENVDKYGKSNGLRYTDEKIHLTTESIIFSNMLAGCTMVFPVEFKKLLSEEGRRPSQALLKTRIHDVWVAGVATVVKGIVYDNRSFMKYRQHENNVVGAKKDTIIDDLILKWKKVKNPNLRNGRSAFSTALVECFGDYIPADSKVRVFSEASNNKLKLIFDTNELCSYNGEKPVLFILKVLLGLF